jgi:hypothetical protein
MTQKEKFDCYAKQAELAFNRTAPGSISFTFHETREIWSAHVSLSMTAEHPHIHLVQEFIQEDAT